MLDGPILSDKINQFGRFIFITIHPLLHQQSSPQVMILERVLMEHIHHSPLSSISVPIKPHQSLQIRLFYPELPKFPSLKRWELVHMPLYSNNSKFITKISAQENPLCRSSKTVHLQQNWHEILQTCIELGDLQVGKAIHGFLVKFGSKNEVFEGNNLINFYAKGRRLEYAHKVFDEMPSRNIITWTSLLHGYSQTNNFESAFLVARQMHRCGERFSEHTCTVILQACGSAGDIVRGKLIHSWIVKCGLETNTFVGTSLVTMYSRGGAMDDAELVFADLIDRDVRCWNSMIVGYGQIGNGEAAIRIFIDLLDSGMEPNDYTLTNVISACHGVLVVEGKQLHALALKFGFMSKISVGNAIITMYGKHRLVEEAESMFRGMSERNLVSWTAVLSGYSQNGHGEKAIDWFLQMQMFGIPPDSCCLATVLDACSNSKNLHWGLQIHDLAIKLGSLSDVCLGTSLVDMYSKCGNLDSAKLVFNQLSFRNTASFNAVLTGYTQKDEQEGTKEDVFVLFNKSRLTGIRPDSITFACLLSLSATEASIVRGKSLHAYSIKSGFEDYITVGNSLITMYAKCGSIEDSCQKFDKMLNRDSVTWNSMVSGYALHGQGKETLWLFETMQEEGIVADEITLLALLQACSYSGLYEEGLQLFAAMPKKYKIKPLVEHYVCMVDLLGRAGHLFEALDFISRSHFEASPLIWRALLNACKLHKDINLGRFAAKRMLELTPGDAASYTLVSNMYSGFGLWGESAKMRVMMNDKKIRKEVGCSWIEIGNRVHRFVANGRDHPQNKEIYTKLQELNGEMKEKGYIPIAEPLLHM